MEILLAFLMALGALAYPLFVDVQKHGRDNILARAAEDVLDWRPLAHTLRAFRMLARGVQHAIEVVAFLVIISGAIWVLSKIIHFL